MAAPAAPVAIEGGALAALTGALILACLVWASLFCLQQFYTYTFGALLHALTNALNRIPLINLGSRTVGTVDKFVQQQLGRALSGAETSVARTWHALAWVARMTAHTVELLASSTLQAFENLTRSDIPQIVNTTVMVPAKALAGQVAGLRADVSALRRAVRAQAIALEHGLANTYGYARANVGAITAGALPALRRRIGGVEAELGELERYAHGAIDRRLGRLEKLAVGTAATAAIVATVSRFAPWWRCSNVGKLGRAACRSDTRFLESLLAGGLLIVGTISLAQMARELREPTELVMGGVEGLVRELRELA